LGQYKRKSGIDSGENDESYDEKSEADGRNAVLVGQAHENETTQASF